MNFQNTVMTIALVLFIVIMIFIGSVLYQNKFGKEFPPVIGTCPDYWINKEVTFNNNNNNNNNEYKMQKCFNQKNLGKPECSKNMDFSSDYWNGSDGDCRKYKWAKSCDITWDGITNNPSLCDKNDSN